MQQRKDIKELFDFLFANYVPDTIIELGTGDGEFTAILRKEGKFIIYSFDTVDKLVIRVEEVFYHIMDIFENEQIIADLIKSSGRVLLLCDDGNKPREVNTFAKYLKSGDVIMAHDYGDDLESFKANNYWGCLEITYKDVEQSLEGFTPFLHDQMLQGAWMSFIKI